MKQVTLVSLYGDKRTDLLKFIALCQEQVKQAVGNAFTPYDIRQVHGTIIGLERRIGSQKQNANFFKHRGRDIGMDFDGFLHFLRQCSHFPFEVQIGGFAERDYPFKSRNAQPYERTFSIQQDKVVVMGWPIRGTPFLTKPDTIEGCVQESRIYPLTLDTIRHKAQRFGVLHSYHQALTDVDNDLFFRIGLLDTNALESSAVNLVQQQIRKFLSEQTPLIVEIALNDVYIAAYEDERLLLGSTKVWSVTDKKVDKEFISQLYE